jgi:hypothetical protein
MVVKRQAIWDYLRLEKNIISLRVAEAQRKDEKERKKE